jgi:hypothetical protein
LNIIIVYFLFALAFVAIALQIVLIINTGELHYLGAGIICGVFYLIVAALTLILSN